MTGGGRPMTMVDLHDLRVAGGLMLAAAMVTPLVPGPDGFPCPLRTITGIPCPLCGMTTSVIATVHLHPATALAASPAGVLAVLVAVVLLVSRRGGQLALPAWTVPVALVLMWLWQLARLGIV